MLRRIGAIGLTLGQRAASRAPGRAKSPMQRTGMVASSPAAACDLPRSSWMRGTSGPIPTSWGRRARAARARAASCARRRCRGPRSVLRSPERVRGAPVAADGPHRRVESLAVQVGPSPEVDSRDQARQAVDPCHGDQAASTRHDVRDGLVRAIIHGDYGPRDRLIEMQSEVDAMAETAARQDVQGAVEHSERFHRIIIEASGNRLLANVWSGLAITPTRRLPWSPWRWRRPRPRPRRVRRRRRGSAA